MSWNYRVCKRTLLKDTENAWDSFSICEVYYNNEEIPDAYAECEPLTNWDSTEHLKGTYELIMDAFDKPIIDLDNFPEEWKE